MKSSAIIFVILIPLLILLSPMPIYSAHAEGKPFLAGIIRPNAKLQNIVDGFKSGMESYGFIEGKNINYIQPDNVTDIDSVIQDMIAKKVDLLFTITGPVTNKAKQKLKETGIPIVFGAVFNPVETGIVKSIPDPGGNITGIQISGSTEKAFEWLLKAVPQAKFIYVPYSTDSEAHTFIINILEKSAEKSHVELVTARTDTPEELTKALAAIPKNADAIFVPNSPFLISNLETIIKVAIERKLPTGSGTGQYKNGIMITYGQDHFHSGKMASRLAKSVLHDKIPAAALPIETTEFFLGINLQTAKSIGITIPGSILQQADFIVR
ncbi:MAG: ABC transporter substrate-binding protein [Nitrospirae bacterium]|nr:ABC transporter substrate-binding protein [Nitrospirota bacterium]